MPGWPAVVGGGCGATRADVWDKRGRRHRAFLLSGPRSSPDRAIVIDFLTVPTATFDIVYLFFVLSLERRRVLPVNVMAHPQAAWTAK